MSYGEPKMMSHEQVVSVLKLLLEATKSKALTWEKSVDGLSDWYCAKLGGREIAFRQLYFEATNQIGADPYMFDLHMPGLNDCFACGTEGYRLMMEILGAAFSEWNDTMPDAAIRFLRNPCRRRQDRKCAAMMPKSIAYADGDDGDFGQDRSRPPKSRQPSRRASRPLEGPFVDAPRRLRVLRRSSPWGIAVSSSKRSEIVGLLLLAIKVLLSESMPKTLVVNYRRRFSRTFRN